MTVTCDSCFTKYRLDDSKISTGGRKVRCSRCQHIFLVRVPPVTEEEIHGDFESSARCHETLMAPDQQKEDASSPLKTETIAEEPTDEGTSSLYQQVAKAETEKEKMVSKDVFREERIKVKTFKIDQNSFGIEWTISN